ncbi:hypothetical protein [Microtetraspora malaysiensis]|uniref:Uncharacterized protein n=1 Tax=Microtetraspora malaysiensis TaxID=161358 RepID=A0ABW6SQG4_9ACTN
MLTLVLLLLLLAGFICLVLAIFNDRLRMQLVAAGFACWILTELIKFISANLV